MSDNDNTPLTGPRVKDSDSGYGATTTETTATHGLDLNRSKKRQAIVLKSLYFLSCFCCVGSKFAPIFFQRFAGLTATQVGLLLNMQLVSFPRKTIYILHNLIILLYYLPYI